VPVIFTSRYRARPGEEAAFLAVAQQCVESPAEWPTGASEARLFQSLDDPGDLLFLSEWERREAFDSNLAGSAAIAALWGLALGPPRRHCFELLRCVRHLGRRVATGACALVSAPPAEQAATRAFMLEALASFEAAPQLVTVYVAQDLDDPTHFLGFAGWQSEAALQAFLQDLLPPWMAALWRQGVRVDLFAGLVRANGEALASTVS
jgi:quinol monooxygenase YgiN